jgi:pantoate--beta-alanine ligase
MKVISSPARINKLLKQEKRKQKSIGFIPTMGALHLGHLSLINRSTKENDITVVSIFVNPIQFGPNEDFRKYPRPVNKDLKLCRKSGVDFVFFPKVKDLYAEDFATFVNVEGLSEVLCGKFRPGHFRGVATIVSKLFNIVGPDNAYFGQKDAQQSAIIKKLAVDLNIPVKVKIMPTIRESDGLALSSRNSYLNKVQRAEASVLFRALKLAEILIKNGARNIDKILLRMRELIKKSKKIRIEYISIVNPDTLRPANSISGRVLIALAVRIGKVRLIDNLIVKV